MSTERDDDPDEGLRRELARLPRELVPPKGLEARVVAALGERGWVAAARPRRCDSTDGLARRLRCELDAPSIGSLDRLNFTLRQSSRPKNTKKRFGFAFCVAVDVL